jgi:hypothetical protein
MAGASGIRNQEWPRHPEKVLAGPAEHLEADGLEFRVVGVLVFAEGVRVLWRVSGVPRAIAELLDAPGVFAGPSESPAPAAYILLSDDLSTSYLPSGATAALQPDSQLAGSSLFAPAPPEGATWLAVTWQGLVLRIDMNVAV